MNGSESTKSQMESQRTNSLSLESARTRSKDHHTAKSDMQANCISGTPPISSVSVLRLGRSSSLARPPQVMFQRRFFIISLCRQLANKFIAPTSLSSTQPAVLKPVNFLLSHLTRTLHQLLSTQALTSGFSSLVLPLKFSCLESRLYICRLNHQNTIKVKRPYTYAITIGCRYNTKVPKRISCISILLLPFNTCNCEIISTLGFVMYFLRQKILLGFLESALGLLDPHTS